MAKLSDHYDSSEFVCHCCGRLPSRGMNPVLITKLEALRHALGDTPIIINSGFRCIAHNMAVGGLPDSQHLLGNAADISVQSLFDDFSLDDVVSKALIIGFDGIGRYVSSGFVHLDVRSNGAEPGVYRWDGD